MARQSLHAVGAEKSSNPAQSIKSTRRSGDRPRTIRL